MRLDFVSGKLVICLVCLFRVAAGSMSVTCYVSLDQGKRGKITTCTSGGKTHCLSNWAKTLSSHDNNLHFLKCASHACPTPEFIVFFFTLATNQRWARKQKHERASKTAFPLFRLFHLIACLLGPSLWFAQAVLAMESASECPLSSRPKATDWHKKQDSVHLTSESLMSSWVQLLKTPSLGIA